MKTEKRKHSEQHLKIGLQFKQYKPCSLFVTKTNMMTSKEMINLNL